VNTGLARRVQVLEAAFREIAATRMAGVPILHPGLSVEAIGFEPEGTWAQGVLVTPWFMNLLRWPLADDDVPLALGVSAARTCGAQALEFIGAEAPGFGRFEACSLFSPMHEFADQLAAVATARELLALLRAPAPPAPSPARRGFLFGRSAVDGAH
jgi:[NiFe] hydrogenase assembly HybE family chaperone